MAELISRLEWDTDAWELYRRVKVEAEALGDGYLGTEHLLLAAMATSPLEKYYSSAPTFDEARVAVLAVTGPHGPEYLTLTPWSQTPRFKLAIRAAQERAINFSRSVQCQDIWLGLLSDPESNVVKVLCHLGVDIRELSRRLAEPDDRSC